ncbi:MAG: endonuclease [Desulfomicrobiaceae bacterium]|jgi:endonuclease-3|nr:endonuclease III [Desulfomicrobiaceae bacterium]MBZ4685963.1 endonuclease [Desulfomicrobiaceae bacterium]HCF05954.1 endonuclease III [Desulfomicrobiaceae bacterium]
MRSHYASPVLERLCARYPAPRTQLTWSTPWELLVATMLSAQTTDAQVNQVTPKLFARWPSPEHLAQAELADIEEVIHSTGFFRAKAKHLQATARVLQERFGGEVPKTMAELLTLPGVARKTANIVLSNAFGIHEGIAVDTHVKRVSFRLGLTTATQPNRIERDLMELFPRHAWGDLNHYLVLFGREVCSARSPRCTSCPLADICPRNGVSQ